MAAAHRATFCLLGSAALFGVTLAVARMHQPSALNAAGIGVAIAVYAKLALTGVFRWPAWVPVAGSTAGVLALVAASKPNYMCEIALLISLFLFSLHSERRVAMTVAAGVIFATIVVSLLRAHGSPAAAVDIAAPPWAALAVALGQAVRSKRAHEAMLVDRARRAEEGRESEARRRVQVERLRIARDLHDAVGHHVALISVQAGAMGYLLDSDLDKARDSLANIQQASEAALEELRLTVGLLRQPGEAEPVEPLGGLSRLDDLIGSFTATGLRVRRSVTGQERPLPEAVDLTAYRVIQESLTNTAKHAPGASATVMLSFGPSMLTITVDDDGAGGAACGGQACGGQSTGHGIIGMRERASALGGWLSAGRRSDDRGFRVTAMLPIPAGTRA